MYKNHKNAVKKSAQNGTVTVEFALTMLIAAAILIPVIYLTLDLARDVLGQFIVWVTPSWP